MRDQIAVIAKANGRSMNAEIIARLEKNLNSNDECTLFNKETLNELADEIAKRLRGKVNT